ncbi:hypothetical protein V2S66_03280 [Streptomyces sp. V4-01]|uniref:Uncharacterized protein n=1 Tax=Actinacidiphila polyblastidii TaxID=3110430 RepID=A0ABU7P5B6_9ACTN|nr:hypothetical protein [Streptomyces sp. V4-01]
MRFRLAFWMKDPPGAPGDVVDVPDTEVDALVRAGIGHPDDGPAPSADDAPATSDRDAAPAPAARRKTTKAGQAD